MHVGRTPQILVARRVGIVCVLVAAAAFFASATSYRGAGVAQNGCPPKKHPNVAILLEGLCFVVQ